MNSRVRIIRKSVQMNQREFANRLGITAPGISKIESGQRKLTDQMILMICKEFNVSERWLRFGEGDMHRITLPNGMEEMADYYHLDELDRRIIYEYITLDERSRKIIKEYIMRVASSGVQKSVLVDGERPGEIVKCAEDKDGLD